MTRLQSRTAIPLKFDEGGFEKLFIVNTCCFFGIAAWDFVHQYVSNPLPSRNDISNFS